MLLNEVQNDNNGFFTTKEEVVDWLQSHRIRRYTIAPDLSVTVNESVWLEDTMPQLPVKFDHVEGNFDIGGTRLITLKGCPRTVLGDFHCESNSLTSIEYAPRHIGLVFSCGWNKITSFHSISDVIEYTTGMEFDKKVTHLLSLLYIDGLKTINSHPPMDAIINRHLRGDRDVFACQEELIDAGYVEQAKW